VRSRRAAIDERSSRVVTNRYGSDAHASTNAGLDPRVPVHSLLATRVLTGKRNSNYTRWVNDRGQPSSAISSARGDSAETRPYRLGLGCAWDLDDPVARGTRCAC
jgi:hypothetical protein